MILLTLWWSPYKEQLSDFAVNTQFKIDTDTIVDEDRKNIPKLMLDKFKDYYPSKSGKASILSFTREHYGWMDPSEMIMVSNVLSMNGSGWSKSAYDI